MSDALASLASAVAERSHVPYSGASEGAAMRLADGRTVAAPRVENASFPLTIPALNGAWALAAFAAAPPVEVALTRPFLPSERAFLDEVAASDGRGPWRDVSPGRVVRGTAPAGPPVSFEVSDVSEGTEAALRVSERAVVPASGFHVGAVLEDAAGRRIAAANVEHAADWTRGLCAERVALVAARAAGLGPLVRVAVACAPAPGGTPCGGCRQVLAELAPDAEVRIWNGADAPPIVTSVAGLLPGAFGGASLRR